MVGAKAAWRHGWHGVRIIPIVPRIPVSMMRWYFIFLLQRRYLVDIWTTDRNIDQILPSKYCLFFCSKTGLRLIILSRGLERSFGDKLAITLSHNFVSMCNFMTVNDFYIRYGTLPHTSSHFCHFLGKLHTLWEVWESVRKLHQICVLKNQAKNQF